MSDKRKKVLVVDDEDDLRAITRISLESGGYAVRQAENGKKALVLLKEEKPDLLVLDLMMPEMNGIELCKRIVEDLGYKDLPVLILSAVNEKAGIIRQFFELPLETQAFMAKPIEPDRVVAKAREMVGDATPEGKKESEAPPKSKPVPRAKPVPAKKPEPPEGPRLKILIIDDEEDIRALLRTTLSLRHNVEAAENGMEALSIIDRVNPDFVITDMNMPMMNGLETVEAIRKHPKFGSIPVFFLTGETDKNLPRKAYDVGGNLYLKKPLDPLRLLALIDRFVEEMEVQPKAEKAPPPKAESEAKADAKPALKRPSGPGAIRILTVDYNVEDISMLKGLLEGDKQGNWETLWAEDARTALGNLGRWEPDVILYNPRNPGLDGIAFNQTLRLKKKDLRYEMAFIGSSFFDADDAYSQKTFGRGVIKFDADPDTIRGRILKVLEAGRAHLKPKTHPIDEINSEDKKHKESIRASRNLSDKQRELFRNKFSQLQTFIDGELNR